MIITIKGEEMKKLIIYSSATGNTKSIADVIEKELLYDEVDIKKISVEEDKNLLLKEINEAELVFIGYWVDRGTADKKILDLSENIKEKSVLLFGTLGADPEGEYFEKCKANVNDLFEGNKILGNFLCQGRISPKLIEMFKKLPEGHAHSLNEERLARYERASTRPNEEDFRNVVTYINKVVEEVV